MSKMPNNSFYVSIRVGIFRRFYTLKQTHDDERSLPLLPEHNRRKAPRHLTINIITSKYIVACNLYHYIITTV